MATGGRIQQLQKLQQSLPSGAQQTQTGLEAARQMRLQEMVKGAPRATSITPMAQQVGGQQAAEAGKAALQNQQGLQKQASQVGALQLGEQKLGQQAQLGQQQRAISAANREQQSRLAELGQETKNKLFDQQMEFSKNQRGQTTFNERQLADWAVANSRSEQELANRMQALTQANKRKLQYLQTQNAKINQALKTGYLNDKQRLDNQARKELLTIKMENERRMAREKNNAANKQAIGRALGTTGGAVAGAYAGGPAGAAAGASMGGEAGSAVGSQL